MPCSLCDLPTPDPPLTAEAVDGTFCCRGCLEVARTLDEPESDFSEPVVESGQERSVDHHADGETAFFAVDGMHCATCETFLERQTARLDGVLDVAASYPTGAIKVVYDADLTDPETIRELASVPGYAFDRPEERDAGEDTGRLLVGVGFGMMAMLWYLLFLYPAYLGVPAEFQLFDLTGGAGQYLIWNVWVFATVVVFYTGRPILRGAWVSVRTGQPNMDLLVGTAATAAYAFSTLTALLGGWEVYFDVSIVVVLAVTVGGYYERRLTRRATDRLADVSSGCVSEARVVDPDRSTSAGDAAFDEATGPSIEAIPIGGSGDGECVPVEDLEGGEYVRVDPGEAIPVDGTVIEGRAGVDASLVTGESRPVDVEPGDDVHGGTVVLDGVLTIRVAAGGASTVDRLIDLLWDVRASRSGVQRLADRLASVFVPFVLAVATLATLWLLSTGAPAVEALLTGLTVLIVSCPCALGLATPLAVASGIRSALDRGVLITDASVVERASEIETVALDKTGTLTTGDMTVLAVSAADGAGQCRAVLQFAAALERHADHPVAAALVDAAEESTIPGTADVRQHAGRGVSGTVVGEDVVATGGPVIADGAGDRRVVAGRRVLFEERDWDVPDDLSERYDRARADGHVPVLVGWDGRARGLVVAADEPRDGWRAFLQALGAQRRVVILTGDDPSAAERFGTHPAVEDVFAGVPPDAKPAVVSRLQQSGPTAMVGDGSNDAPALARADLGVAMGGGTDVATDAAAVVIEDDDVDAVPTVFSLTRAIRRRVRENLAWAFLYNAVAIPAAVLGVLNPVVAAVAMATSSLLVVANSSRRLDAAL
jgi:Cu2+-exporting ATPase